MTVKDLKDKLNKFDDNAKVMLVYKNFDMEYIDYLGDVEINGVINPLLISSFEE